MTYTKYPNSIDTSSELPKATDNVTPVMAEVINRLREAILAIENELGINPSSIYGTVRDRLDALDGYASSDGYAQDGYSITIYDGYDITIQYDGYDLPPRSKLNFSGNVTLLDDEFNDVIEVNIPDGSTVDFTSVKNALALADSAISFANQKLTDLQVPTLNTDAARLQEVLDAINSANSYADGIETAANLYTDTSLSLANSYTDNAISAIIDNGITQLTQDVLAGDGYGDGYGSQVATVVGLQTRPLSDSAPTTGDVLTWNGSIWIPTAPTTPTTGGLQTLADINFTSETPIDIKAGGDGTYNFGGINFTVVNTASANAWSISNTQGMCIQPASTFNVWPAFYTPILTLAPNCDLMTQNTFIVMHVKRGTIGAGGTYDQWILSGLTRDAVWSNAGPTTYAAYANGYLSNNFIQSFGVIGFGSNMNSGAPYTDDWNNTIQMLSMVGGGQIPQWAIQTYSSFPGTGTAIRRFSGEQPMQDASFTWSQAQTSFFCEIVAGGSSNIGVEFEIHRLAVYGR